MLDEWQSWFLTEALAEQPNHQWSAFEVALLVSRQVGKGSILEARQLAGLALLGERLQVHTAHEFKTCFEHFLRMVNLVEACPDIDRQIMRIRRGAGEQAIEMRSGARLRFMARSGGSGRGMSGDAVYLDEAFALTAPMMGALLPTLSARPNPQVWYTSSAPLSTSTVLHGVRDRGIDGKSPRLFFAEWSAPAGVNFEDVDAWYQAVPALGIRITEDFIRAEYSALQNTPGEFGRERLGIPDALVGSDARPTKLDPNTWRATVKPKRQWPDRSPGKVTITFDVDSDGKTASISMGAGSISAPYVETLFHEQGTSWLPDKLVEVIAAAKPIAIGCNGVGNTAAMVGPIIKALQEAGLSTDIVQLGTKDYTAACAGFHLDVVEGRLIRPDTPQGALDRAAIDATERIIGDSWAWERRLATVPISPLVSATVARALLPVDPGKPYDIFAF